MQSWVAGLAAFAVAVVLWGPLHWDFTLEWALLFVAFAAAGFVASRGAAPLVASLLPGAYLVLDEVGSSLQGWWIIPLLVVGVPMPLAVLLGAYFRRRRRNPAGNETAQANETAPAIAPRQPIIAVAAYLGPVAAFLAVSWALGTEPWDDLQVMLVVAFVSCAGYGAWASGTRGVAIGTAAAVGLLLIGGGAWADHAMVASCGPEDSECGDGAFMAIIAGLFALASLGATTLGTYLPDLFRPRRS